MSPPQSASPQVTTDPSARIAAKAPREDWICCTPLSWSRTAELSLPQSASPQVTTDPSSRIAAKALAVVWICCTPLSWSRTAELSPPQSAPPQVTTDPSARIAAKALSMAWICCTPLSWSRTAELSPPQSAPPQVTTDPSARIAAKALSMAWICCTPLSWSRTAELSLPQSALPQVMIALSPGCHKAKTAAAATTCGWSIRAVRHSPSSIPDSSRVWLKSTRTRFLAVISLRYFFPKACWAFVLTSWTVEEGRSVRSSECPLGKATFIWIIWDVLRSWWLFKTSAMNLYFRLWAQAMQWIHDGNHAIFFWRSSMMTFWNVISGWIWCKLQAAELSINHSAHEEVTSLESTWKITRPSVKGSARGRCLHGSLSILQFWSMKMLRRPGIFFWCDAFDMSWTELSQISFLDPHNFPQLSKSQKTEI